MEADTTIVIFRKWRAERDRALGDGIIALFPCEPWDNAGLTCASYEHHGQHGGSDLPSVMTRTVAATPDEYAPLKQELESPPFGYTFTVRLRTPANAADMRRKALEQQRGSARA